jgi:hypothetical protein
VHRSKYVDEFKGQRFDYVLTVCDNVGKTARFSSVRPSVSTGTLKTRRRFKVTKKSAWRSFAGCGTKLGPT